MMIRTLTGWFALLLLVGTGCSKVADGQEGEPAVKISEKAPNTDIIYVRDVKAGMKGYGLSVFQGSTVERFDVEVMSVLPKYFGGKDIIMVRCKHPVTDHAYIIHGMSGSPIYLEVDGAYKLAGALALGFSSLPKDPIAGITPIEYMLADKDHPMEDENAYVPGLTKDSPYQFARTPLFVSGAPMSAFKNIRTMFEPAGFEVYAGAAGPMHLDEEIKIEMGGSVGISFMRGDINYDGIGTVSYVKGDDVLVFGHPMMMGGQMELPMTTAYVHTVIADQSYSYKMASAVKNVGTMLQDRMTSVYGVLGKKATMIPFTVDIENPATKLKRSYTFELARHPLYTPALVAQVPGMCLELAEASSGKDASIEYEVNLKFKDYPEITLTDLYVAPAFGYSTGGFQQTMFEIVGNPFRKVQLEKAHVTLRVVHRRKSATLEGVSLDSREVKPGDTLTLTARLRPYNKIAINHTIQVPLPHNLPDGTYRLQIMGGQAASGVMSMQDMMMAMMSGGGGLSRSQPDSFEELLDSIQRRHAANRIMVRMELPTLGMRYKDKKLENLPGSVFANLMSGSSNGLRVEADMLEILKETDWFIEGKKYLKFDVRTPGQAEPKE